MYKILFVCHGNICRSTMAECIFKNMVKDSNNYLIDSCGISSEETGNSIYPPAREILEKNNIPIVEHYARKITYDDLDNFDYIVCMEQRHIDTILYRYGDNYKNKCKLLIDNYDISDPWYTRDFKTCYKEINEWCINLLKYLERR